MVVPGDVVRGRDRKHDMTVASVQGDFAWCIWFDSEQKQRRLRFWQSDLLLVNKAD